MHVLASVLLAVLTQTINVNVPDLTATMAATPETVAGGGIVTYTTTVRNVGQVAFSDPQRGTVYFTAPANGIGVLVTLPGSTVYRSVAATGGFACANVAAVVTCSGGSLNANESATITVTATAPTTAGDVIASVVIDPTNAIAERNEGNNVMTASASVPPAALSVSMTAPAQVDDQASLDYRVWVTNATPAATASNVSFRLTLPTGSGYFGANDYGAGFACSRSGDVVTCNAGTVAAGDAKMVKVMTFAPRTHGLVSGTVVLGAAQSATASVNIHGRPDLRAEVRYGWLVPGGILQRSITVRNDGAGPAASIDLSIDALTSDPPPGTAGADQYVAYSADHGFMCSRTSSAWPAELYESGDRISCTGGSVAAGSSAVITVNHLFHWNSPYRRTRVTIDGANQIREANEGNNSTLFAAHVW